MNNFYVDELPKKGACLNGCPYAITDTWVSYCPFQQDKKGDHLIVEENCIKTCPLKLLTDRLAEERKRVCDKLKDYITRHYLASIRPNGDIILEITLSDLNLFLDQIERGG